MNYNPLVSIVVPLYNSQNDIENCLESIFRQTYKNYEVIIVDDGSTDNSVYLVEHFISKHTDMQILLLHQQNFGPSKARNEGVLHSKGDLIAFLDSDDEWKSDKLSSMVPFFVDNEVGIVSSLYSIANDCAFNNLDNSVKLITPNRLLFKNYFITSATVCRANVLKKYLFNELQKYSEDYRLWLEICFSGYKCLLFNSCLTKMNSKPIYGGSGLSSKLYEMEKGEWRNYYHLLKISRINFFQFLCAISFSSIKYIYRIVDVKIKKR